MTVAGLARDIVPNNADQVVHILNGMELWKAVLSGGGEPMVHPEFCEKFIAEVSSPQLEEIELITSAHFAETPEAAAESIRKLVACWRGRPDYPKVRFSIRISLDWFHAQRIGVEPAARVIELLGTEEYRDVHCYIRSVLLSKDNTFERLADRLDATLSPIKDYQQDLVLANGRTILVYHKNLIVEGRMNQRKLEKLPVDLPTDSTVEVFGERFKDSHGRQVPARTYNGPTVRHLDGLACLMDDVGQLRILEGNDVGRSANALTETSWSSAISYLYQDPITVFLVENGPEALAVLLEPYFSGSIELAHDTNQLYHLTELLLDTPEKKLVACLVVLAGHVAERRIHIEKQVLETAWENMKAVNGLVK